MTDELVDLVDEKNLVVGQVPRSRVRKENLLHRGVGILCRNSRGEVFVHQRTASKDLFPSLYDMFVGGVVGTGESYEAAAAREIEEELGIRDRPLEYLFTHLYDGPRNRSFIQVYQVLWDGPVVTQESEVAWGEWMPETRLPEWTREVEIVPDGLEVFHRLLEWQKTG